MDAKSLIIIIFLICTIIQAVICIRTLISINRQGATIEYLNFTKKSSLQQLIAYLGWGVTTLILWFANKNILTLILGVCLIAIAAMNLWTHLESRRVLNPEKPEPESLEEETPKAESETEVK